MADSLYALRAGREPSVDIWSVIHFVRVPNHKVAWFTKAHHCSKILHSDVFRKSGESFYRHDARCALMAAAAELPIEVPTIMYAHEFKEDNGWTLRRLERHFGRDVAVTVHALSKAAKARFPDPGGRRKRALHHIDRMKKGTESGPILEGRYGHNWFVPVGKGLDRYDNSTDTAALPEEAQERLFAETDTLFLPYFYWAFDYIPKKYRAIYRMLVTAIENNCDNYWRARALRHA